MNSAPLVRDPLFIDHAPSFFGSHEPTCDLASHTVVVPDEVALMAAAHRSPVMLRPGPTASRALVRTATGRLR